MASVKGWIRLYCRELTEIIGDVEAWRARLTNAVEVALTFGHLARIDHLSLGEKDKLVEEGDDIAARLVDGEDDGTIVVSREGNETLHNIIRVVRVET